MVVEHTLFEHRAHVKGAVGAVDEQSLDVLEDIVGQVGVALVALDAVLQVLPVERVRLDPRQHRLRQGGGADLEHLGVEDRLHVGGEHRVAAAVVHLDPAAAAARPGHLLGDAAHADRRHPVADDRTQRRAHRAVVGHVLVDLVADDEQVVLLADLDDGPHHVRRVDRAGGVVRVDDEDAGHGRVVLDVVFEVLEVRVPEVVRIEDVGDRLDTGVGRLGGTVGGVAGRGHDHPGGGLEEAVDLGDGVAQAVEKDDVVRVDLHPAPRVGAGGHEFAGRLQPPGRAVAVGGVLVHGLGDDLLHPVGHLLALGNGVADVLPVDLDAHLLELFADANDVANLVVEFACTTVQYISTHGNSSG